jgi:hypothetical protein
MIRPLSLAERDRRWQLLRDLTRDEGLDALPIGDHIKARRRGDEVRIRPESGLISDISVEPADEEVFAWQR